MILQVGAAALVVLVLVGLVGAVDQPPHRREPVDPRGRRADQRARRERGDAGADRRDGDDPAAAARRPRARWCRSACCRQASCGSSCGLRRAEIVYSDEPRLDGVRFGLDDGGAGRALRDPQVRAEISDLSQPENRFERGQGTLLEVYRPVWTPNGQPLLFETYFRYDQVSDRAASCGADSPAITLSSIAAVVVLLVAAGLGAVARARRAHQQREEMLQRAMDASLDERRRIAATLHDGVVQELAAASFAVAGSGRGRRRTRRDELAERLREAGDDRAHQHRRHALVARRHLPAEPAARAGLGPALRDLRDVRCPTRATSVDVDDAARALTAEQQQACFRVAQECLRNAVEHARPTRVTIALGLHDATLSVLEIADDGRGFDVTTRLSAGHFGLPLIVEVARSHRRGTCRCAARRALGRAGGLRCPTDDPRVAGRRPPARARRADRTARRRRRRRGRRRGCRRRGRARVRSRDRRRRRPDGPLDARDGRGDSDATDAAGASPPRGSSC